MFAFHLWNRCTISYNVPLCGTFKPAQPEYPMLCTGMNGLFLGVWGISSLKINLSFLYDAPPCRRGGLLWFDFRGECRACSPNRHNFGPMRASAPTIAGDNPMNHPAAELRVIKMRVLSFLSQPRKRDLCFAPTSYGELNPTAFASSFKWLE